MPPLQILRYTVFRLVVLAVIIALSSWLIRTRRVSPFSVLGRALRAVTDPVIRPVERRLVRMGGNPGHAGGWLVVITAGGGGGPVGGRGGAGAEVSRRAVAGGGRST